MKSILRTSQAPAAIGPYNQAVITGNRLYTAGQIPLDPATGQLVEGDFKDRVRRVMHNLEAILQAGGTHFENVVKTTIFVTDLGQFAELNEVYAEFFEAETAPARSTVEVAALPLGTDVEIEMIAEL